MNKNKRIIAISGAGIAGMTAALFLERQGYRVLLFERAPKLSQSGTGIQISPNAYKVLSLLGLGRSVSTVGFAPEKIEIRSGRTGHPIADFQLGEKILKRHGAPYTTVHRVDLGEILLTACRQREDIDVHFGLQVSDLTMHANGLTLLCEGVERVSEFVVNAVIGADGAWSGMRRFVHDAATPQFTGQIAWRVLIDAQTANPVISRTSTGLWLGPNSHLVHYPVRGGNLLNVIAIAPWDKEYAPRRGWLDQSVLDERTLAFDHWQPHLRELVSSRAHWGGWPIFAAPSAGKFANGPLCLIGDAAHPMVPYGAQGGAAAIEDAFVLASQCQNSPQDLAAAFARFERIRKSRINRVMRLSRNNKRIYHLARPLSWGRNAVMKATPQDKLQKRMDWIYGWEPKSIELQPPLAPRLLERLTGLWKKPENEPGNTG